MAIHVAPNTAWYTRRPQPGAASEGGGAGTAGAVGGRSRHRQRPGKRRTSREREAPLARGDSVGDRDPPSPRDSRPPPIFLRCRARRSSSSSRFALAGCLGEAPHENPLDPLSDAYRDAGTVEGRVTGIYPPFEGREGVRVLLTPLAGGAEIATRTDASGAFRLDAIASGLYEVVASGDGFRAATDTVEVAWGRP